jgi:hypothetical protein
LLLLPSALAAAAAAVAVCCCAPQCFAADKAGVGRNARPPRGRPQYCANLAMKINTKMGGVNVKLVDDPKVVSLLMWLPPLHCIACWNEPPCTQPAVLV